MQACSLQSGQVTPRGIFTSYLSAQIFCISGWFYLVELSGIEPLTSSLRIQNATSDGEIPDGTE